MVVNTNNIQTTMKTQYMDVNRVSSATTGSTTATRQSGSAKEHEGDAAVLTILNSTRRKVDYMERSIINENVGNSDKTDLLQAMTRLSVRVNDGTVSPSSRRELRSEISNILLDINKMSMKNNAQTAESTQAVETTPTVQVNAAPEMVKKATENILSDAKAAMMAQANQTNASVLNLL